MNDSIKAVILKQADYREADAILTVMTAEYGKLSFIAPGIRKMTSRNAGSLLPFTETEIQYDHRPGKTMFRLKTARSLRLFRKLHEDLTLSASAGVIAELTDVFCMPGDDETSAEQYELLCSALAFLNEGRDPLAVTGLFASDMMKMYGIAPDVDECVRCFSTLVSAVSAKEGGFLCAKCAGEAGVPLTSPTALKRFRLLVKAGLVHYDAVENAGGIRKEDLELLMDMIRLHAGVQIRSFSFFTGLLSIE